MKISIINESISSLTTESQAAKQLKDMLAASVPNDIKGQIKIVANVSLPDQVVKDIDLVVWGDLSNCILPHFYTNETTKSTKDLQVKDFFLVIELKSHSAGKVCCKDSHLFVKYANEIKDVTLQSEDQRFSMMYYLQQSCNVIVRVTNAIWFNSIDKDELYKITSNRNLGALPSVFTFKDLITTIIEQGMKPTRDLFNDRYVLSAGIDSEEINANILKLFK